MVHVFAVRVYSVMCVMCDDRGTVFSLQTEDETDSEDDDEHEYRHRYVSPAHTHCLNNMYMVYSTLTR